MNSRGMTGSLSPNTELFVVTTLMAVADLHDSAVVTSCY